MSVRSETLAAVDNEWRRASEIHRRGDLWNARSARDALTNLATEGTIEKRTVVNPGGSFVCEFRLPKKETAP